ncbi:MAG TPA: hypothetical protein DD490_06110 [Acidobacteria bacterium]|nr:hypothetical protein [Acidobacteriota bacterium]
MPKKPLFVLAALALLLSAGSARAQKLNVKPGLWEARVSGMSTPTQVCYTAEVLDHGFSQIQNPPGLKCKNEIKQSTPRLIVAHTACTGNMTVEGDTRLEITSSESMVMVSDMVMGTGGGKQKVQATVNYKWLRADCGKVKPFDPQNPFPH